jgi:hypothetical protein
MGISKEKSCRNQKIQARWNFPTFSQSKVPRSQITYMVFPNLLHFSPHFLKSPQTLLYFNYAKDRPHTFNTQTNNATVVPSMMETQLNQLLSSWKTIASALSQRDQKTDEGKCASQTHAPCFQVVHTRLFLGAWKCPRKK